MVNTKVLGVFIAAYVSITIAVALIELFVADLTAGGAIATLSAALLAGQYFVRSQGRAPTSQESWLYSVAFLVAIMLISAFQLLAFDAPIALGWGGLFVAILVGYSLILFLACRVVFAKGAKWEMKARTKRMASS